MNVFNIVSGNLLQEWFDLLWPLWYVSLFFDEQELYRKKYFMKINRTNRKDFKGEKSFNFCLCYRNAFSGPFYGIVYFEMQRKKTTFNENHISSSITEWTWMLNIPIISKSNTTTTFLSFGKLINIISQEQYHKSNVSIHWYI